MLIELEKRVINFLLKFFFLLFCFVSSRLATLFYRRPSRDILVIGVVGSFGKTTSANTIHHMLQANGIRAGLLSTANFKIGNKEWKMGRKIGSFGLQKKIKEMVKSECRAAVLEIASEDILQHRTYGVVFDVLVFTNRSSENAENRLRLEKKLFSRLGKSLRKKVAFPSAGLSKKTLIANIDDIDADGFLKSASDQKLGFSVLGKASLFAEEIVSARDNSQSKDGIDFVLEVGEDRARVHSPLLGSINTYNLLSAATIGHLAGFSIEGIVKALESFPGIAGRMERIVSKKGYDVIIDYAMTPEALQTLYRTLRSLYKGKIVAVFGSRGEIGKTKRMPMGRVVSGYADYSILTNENPFGEDPHEIVRDIAKGFHDNDRVEGKDYELIVNREHAIEKALLMAEKEGDVVVITGRGSEATMNIMGKWQPFNDREIVLKYLK